MSGIQIILVIAFLGIASNVIGGVLGYFSNVKTQAKIQNISGFTAGLMTAIICFDLMQEAFAMGNIFSVCIYILIGVFIIMGIDSIMQKKRTLRNARSAVIVLIAMGAHNITEGLAVGSAFEASIGLGVSILIAIMLHNVPEGMIVGVTEKLSGKRLAKILMGCLVIGILEGVGGIIGVVVGGISSASICACLSLSAGAMLYIVAGDLIPDMGDKKGSFKTTLCYIIGILLGAVITKL